MTKLTINILTWNSEDVIEDCIKHCLDQDLTGLKVNVIDNHSTDGTLNICSKFSDRITIIVNDGNYGYCGGHNIGIRNSDSEYVLVLNPDVFLEPGYCSGIVAHLDRHPEWGGAIGKVLQLEKRDGTYTKTSRIDTMGLAILKSRQFIARNIGKEEASVAHHVEEVFGVDGMAAVYRRKMLEDIKEGNEYFDELFFAYCEDQDLSWRARNKGWKFSYIPESIAYHVRSWKPNSLSHRKLMSPHLRRMAIRNHYMMVMKNDKAAHAIVHAPFILLRFMKIVVYSLLFERHTLGALSDVVSERRNYLPKRKKEIIKRTTIEEFKRWIKLK